MEIHDAYEKPDVLIAGRHFPSASATILHKNGVIISAPDNFNSGGYYFDPRCKIEGSHFIWIEDDSGASGYWDDYTPDEEDDNESS